MIGRRAGLFGLLVAIYFLAYSGWPVSGDEQVIFDGASSFYRSGTLELGYFSSLRPYFPLPYQENRPVLWLDVEPLQAYAAAALIWIGAQLQGIGLVHAAWTLNLWITALTAVVLYDYGVLLGYRDRTALIAALVFGLATTALPYSRLFFREPLFTLLALSCADGLERWRHRSQKRWIGAAALLAAGALLTKGIGLLLIPMLLVIVLPALTLNPFPVKREGLKRFLFPFPSLRGEGPGLGGLRRLFTRRVLVIGALIAWFFVLVVIYQQVAPSPRYRYALAWLRSLDVSYIVTSFSADLVSPGFSLWIFSPVLTLSLAGLWLLIRSRHWREVFVPLTLAISLIGGYSLFHGESWYGGLGWGPRYLLPLTPFLALWLLPAVDALPDQPVWARALAAGLFVQSICVQVMGVITPVEAFGRYLAQEGARLDRMIYAWIDGTWNLLYTPLVVSAHQAGETQIAWLVNHSGPVVLPLCALTIGLSLIVMTGTMSQRRRLASGAAVIGALLTVYIGLRTFDADPRFGGSDSTLRAVIDKLDPHPGDAIILNDAAYRNTFMNYYKAREPIYVMPDAPGERATPTSFPLVQSDNPEEQAHPYTWVLLSRLARKTQRWLFVTEFGPYSPGRTRPTEHFLIRHYFLEHEVVSLNVVRVLIFQPAEAPSERHPPAEKVDIDFGAARLTGFDLPPGHVVQAGSMLPVSLVWQQDGWPSDLPPFDYSVNLSLVGSNGQSGQLIAQYAGPPQGTFGAMSRWKPGVSYRDNHALAIPAGTPPGDYDLRITVYDWRDGKPLPVRDARSGSPHNDAVIGPIHVAVP